MVLWLFVLATERTYHGWGAGGAASPGRTPFGRPEAQRGRRAAPPLRWPPAPPAALRRVLRPGTRGRSLAAQGRGPLQSRHSSAITAARNSIRCTAFCSASPPTPRVASVQPGTALPPRSTLRREPALLLVHRHDVDVADDFARQIGLRVHSLGPDADDPLFAVRALVADVHVVAARLVPGAGVVPQCDVVRAGPAPVESSSAARSARPERPRLALVVELGEVGGQGRVLERAAVEARRRGGGAPRSTGACSS